MKIIAELGTCDGKLDYAIHAAVRAAQAGAWAVKVQMYHPDRLFAPWAERYDRLGGKQKLQVEDAPAPIAYDQWEKVKKVCDDLGVEFFASVWDEEAIDACEAMDVRFYKIGSADITHQPLIEKVASMNKGIFLSTGASELAEVERALGWIADAYPSKKMNLILLACTLSYPTELADANLSRIAALATAFPGIAVGYSDHTTTLHAPWVAASLGAPVLERHFSVTPGAGGDHNMAANFEQLKQICELGDAVPTVLGPFPPKFEPIPAELAARDKARRSIVTAVDIKQGTPLTVAMLKFQRPGDGIPPYQLTSIVGGKVGETEFKQQRATVDIPAGTQLRAEWYGLTYGSLTVE